MTSDKTLAGPALTTTPTTPAEDANAPLRKKDHIEMAFRSQVDTAHIDPRFYYEPMLAAHPLKEGGWPEFSFLGHTFRAPLWVSSMTGGTQLARQINHHLARACGEFGFGMGLGSCRALLYSDEYFPDFNVRPVMGPGVPLYANLGIAQVEKLLARAEAHVAEDLVGRLQADGLIIHVNPTQEWLQPEGDVLARPPIDTIADFSSRSGLKIIVKEVGQGFGPASLRALLALPIEAVDFAASGGTNFALLELLRSDPAQREAFAGLSLVGHSAAEMVDMANQLVAGLGPEIRCRQVIISGGVKNFLDGYYLTQRLRLPSVYGQASAFLKHAQESYESLHQYVQGQLQGLAYARAFLRVRST
jgi:isopentenyl-diphosphate delta-isomerase